MNSFLMNHFYLFAQGCKESTFFGIGSWHKYLEKTTIVTKNGEQLCEVNFGKLGIGSFWLVIAGLIDILLRIGALVAVGYFIYGAFRMVTSQGSPDAIKAARGTMTNALIGLVITVFATWLVGFLVGVIIQ
jgi:hypothetical protein